MVAKRLLDERVDVAVRVNGVVVKERKLLDARLLGERESLLVRRMSESRVGLVLLGAVLGVVDEEVRVLAPVRHVLQRPVLVVGEQGNLVVRRERKARR